MQKFLTVCAAALMTLAVAVSCGSAKKAQQREIENSLGVEKAISPAQMYAESAPSGVQRAWASYNDIDPTIAMRGAAALARAELAAQIGVAVEDGIRLYRGKNSQYAADEQKSAQVSEGGGEDDNQIKTATDEIVEGSRIVKTNIYEQKNGTNDAYVCVEIDVDLILQRINNNTQIMDLISEQDKELTEQDRKDFENEMRDLFERYRSSKR